MGTEQDAPVIRRNPPPEKLPDEELSKAAAWWEKKSNIAGLKNCSGLSTIAVMFYRQLPKSQKVLFAIEFYNSVIEPLKSTKALKDIHKQETPPLPKHTVLKHERIIRSTGLQKYYEAGKMLRKAALSVGLPEDHYVRVGVIPEPIDADPKGIEPYVTPLRPNETKEQQAIRQNICDAINIRDLTKNIEKCLPRAGKYSRNAYLIRFFCLKLRKHKVDIELLDKPYEALADLLDLALDFDVGMEDVRDAARSLK